MNRYYSTSAHRVSERQHNYYGEGLPTRALLFSYIGGGTTMLSTRYYADNDTRHSMRGMPKQPPADPLVAEFVEQAHDVEGIGNLWIMRKQIGVTFGEVEPTVVDDVAAALHQPIGHLILQRFGDDRPVEFMKLRDYNYGNVPEPDQSQV